ncbi:hypothetical protein C2845_PM06G35360 [Panicum miliaceum]|uniref:Reverse transcriptase zinc-binding domain-containing protein n=1 Tax=Panicum miliaceum TaxID=4540 RepID=A0A3L6RAJ4_PANMI|nr:hypothetical protein C2845_PM06G35360 [Panicum miliaceum]
MAEFVVLWERVQEVQFSDDPDKIIWKWTANGVYSSKSAYAIQFVGSYCTFNTSALWKAKAEGKHRFFAWLQVQAKIQTADNLLLKGIACDPEVWFLVREWTGGLITMPLPGVQVEEWWNLSLQAATAENRSKVAAILIYTGWNLWNERTEEFSRGLHNQLYEF